MASGYGWGGGRSRCFTYWQEFQKCYIQSEHPSECTSYSNDYLECLHHPKELQRAAAIKKELTRRLEHDVKEANKKAEILAGGAIAAVGLIQKSKPADSSTH